MSDLTARTSALSLRTARLAAAAARHADLGAAAIRTVRPAGVGLVRARGPLWLQLYVASREGRLVYRDVGSFALLEPPTAREVRVPANPFLRLLRTLDRYWEMLAFAVPSAALLVAALLVGLAKASIVLVLALITLALLYVVVFLGAGLLRGLVWLSRLGRRTGRPGQSAAASAPAHQWSIPLLHQVDPDRVDDLVQAASDRLARIVERRVRQHGQDEGVRMATLVAHPVLIVLTSGVTVAASRDRLLETVADHHAPYGRNGEVVFVVSTGGPTRPAREPVIGGGGFLLLYLVGVALAVVVAAMLVADDEAARCGGPACAGRPTTWASAVRYLSQRLLLSDPDGLSPAGVRGTTLGWLVSVLGLTTVFVAFVAFRQEIARVRDEKDEWRTMLDSLAGRTRVLLLVTTDVERNALFQVATERQGRSPRAAFNHDVTIYGLGAFANADVFMVQAGDQGTQSAAAMPQTTRSAIDVIEPDYAILTGVCYGLKPAADAVAAGRAPEGGTQQLGDVLVSRYLQGLDHVAIREHDGEVRAVRRGEHVIAAPVLIDRCQAAQASWPSDGTQVHFGQMLSANTLLDSWTVVQALRKEFPNAIGGEMEGIGVYTSASLRKVDWIMVKGICDWGFDKAKDHQEAAAFNAATFVTHLIDIGALQPRRARLPVRSDRSAGPGR